MKIERSLPRYRWRWTWSGNIGDYTGDDDGVCFARVVYRAENRPAQAWTWSLLAFKDANRRYYGLNGFAETARLAVRNAEDAYEGVG